jgi:hypothetical protein
MIKAAAAAIRFVLIACPHELKPPILAALAAPV